MAEEEKKSENRKSQDVVMIGLSGILEDDGVVKCLVEIPSIPDR